MNRDPPSTDRTHRQRIVPVIHPLYVKARMRLLTTVLHDSSVATVKETGMNKRTRPIRHLTRHSGWS
jgi:hypothetical protein